MDYEIFKKRLKGLIKAKEEEKSERLTYKKIADECGEFEEYTLKKWMSNDKSRPDISELAILCKYFGCEADYLLGLSDVPVRKYESISKETGLSYQAVETLQKLSENPIQSQFGFVFDPNVKDEAALTSHRINYPYAIIEAVIQDDYQIREMIYEYIFRPETPKYTPNITLSCSSIGAIYTDCEGVLKINNVEAGDSFQKQALLQRIQDSLEELRAHFNKIGLEANPETSKIDDIISKELYKQRDRFSL